MNILVAWRHLLATLTLVLPMTEGYTPDEKECPDVLHPGISSSEYWVPFNTPYRAWRTLPWKYFVIKPSGIKNAGLGVFATTFIPGNTWLAEYEGEIMSAFQDVDDLLVYAWNGYTDDEVTHYVDGVNPETSNWLRFINTPNHESEENVSSHYCFGKVYYRTRKDILPGQELLTYYGDYYAKKLGIFDHYYDSQR